MVTLAATAMAVVGMVAGMATVAVEIDLSNPAPVV